MSGNSNSPVWQAAVWVRSGSAGETVPPKSGAEYPQNTRHTKSKNGADCMQTVNASGAEYPKHPTYQAEKRLKHAKLPTFKTIAQDGAVAAIGARLSRGQRFTRGTDVSYYLFLSVSRISARSFCSAVGSAALAAASSAALAAASAAARSRSAAMASISLLVLPLLLSERYSSLV